METGSLFSYYWHESDEDELVRIRLYGIGVASSRTLVRIEDFTPYAYLELPEKTVAGSSIPWNRLYAQRVLDAIAERTRTRPAKSHFLYKRKLYFHSRDREGREMRSPFLLVSFLSSGSRRGYSYQVHGREYSVAGLGKVILRLHETDATAVLQLCCHRRLPAAGWIEFRGRRVPAQEMISRCDREYLVSWRALSPKDDPPPTPVPRVLSMDMEVNSTNPARMPQARVPGDKIFQIGCIFFGAYPEPRNILLSIGDPDDSPGIEVRRFKTEADLLIGYTALLKEFRPNVVTGYNIQGFDIEYMMDRSKSAFIYDELRGCSFTKYVKSSERKIKWSSSAYKNQEFKFLDLEGILHIDLLPVVRRDYKFSSYSLSAVGAFFVGDKKDDLTPEGIFRCYREGMRAAEASADTKEVEKGRAALARCARYCIQDCELVRKLFQKLQTWIGLTEMARVCNVPMFTLCTSGQQIRVYSQVYLKCMYDERVVQRDGYIPDESERYTGAYVFPPKPGMYRNVVPFDFSSLYPTTMIAFNIDYSTLVQDESIDDRECNVISWEEHRGCPPRLDDT